MLHCSDNHGMRPPALPSLAVLLSFAALLLAHAAAAAPSVPTIAPESCMAAIEQVQRETPLPPHLLAAIGLVESGRRDPHGTAWRPWPWTIDVAGQSAFYDSKGQAIAAVRDWQAQGVQSIDVGCMQVNLAQHPDAFGSLEQAFDPRTNVRYAARFLSSLFVRTGDWPAAAGLYHSATPALGAAYRRRVLVIWSAPLQPVALRGPSALSRAWAATMRTIPSDD